MKATIKTFPCEDGDCIIMRLADEHSNESFHIMIDCGALTTDITNYVCNEIDKRIDLLFATHIDSDHIDGITAMLMNEARLSDLKIGRIIYNCYQNVEVDQKQKLPNNIVSKLDLVRCLLGFDTGTHISYKSSVSLGAYLSGDKKLSSIWNKNLITENSECLNLGCKWGKIQW